jgi:hypothetical protein
MAGQSREFTFHLHTCRLGGKVQRIPNPFTGEIFEMPIDDGLSAAEIKAVKKLLAEHKAAYGDDDEFHVIRFSDDTTVRLGIGNLRTKRPIKSIGVELICPKLSDEAVAFVHAVATAAGAAFVTVDSENAALTAPSDDPKVRRRWPEASILAAPKDLARWLEKVVGGRKVKLQT